MGTSTGERRERAADGLISFVPRLAVELATEPGNRHVAVAGSMLSADISGFTALSERLAAKGKAGAEEITELINVCFDALIGEAYAQNGEILKFGGDAILVMFRGDDHERRCVTAALAMQRTLHSLPGAKRASLTMTVGAHTGVFDAFLVGSGYRELIVTGAEATHVIALEGAAEKGETLVSDSLLAAVPDIDAIRRYGGGHQIDGVLDSSDRGPTHRSDLDITGPVLADLIPSAVSSQLGGVLHLGGEHRQLGICFVLVTGVTEHLRRSGAELTATALGDFVDQVVVACGTYGTALLHSDIAEHGAKFVLTAGAPTSHGNNADAVLRTALSIASAETPFDLRIGIQTGRGFAGFLGAPQRRCYTVMGDPVNTAARMLGQANHRDVIAMHDVIRSTDTIFFTEELEPFLVKGKAEPVVAHRVFDASDETRIDRAQVPLVGRVDELRQLDDLVARGGAVELTGPAGSGKTRLIEATLQRAITPTLRCACTQYGATSPYAALRPLFRSVLGIDLYTDPATAGDIITKVVRAECDHLTPMVPLLASAFGADVERTDEADAIDPEFRRAALARVMGDFLATIITGDMTFVIEDIQWIDESSLDLLHALETLVPDRGWSLIVSRRDTSDSTVTSAHTIELGTMPDHDIRHLSIEASTRALSDTEVTTVVQRAAGNPLFALELTRAISDDADTAIPDTVERLLANRIDQLDPASRLYVRMASVLGLEAHASEVDAIVEAEAPGLEPDRAALAHILEPRAKGRVGFVNALYRDAAYEGLPYKRRRRLHRVVAQHLELSFDEESTALASTSLLAFHFSEAAEHLKAWSYGVLAGDLARLQWANQTAAAVYQRALDSARRIRQVDSDVIVRVLGALADCLLVNGDFDGANTAIDHARKRNRDLAIEVDLMRRRGVVAERRGDPSTAERWFRRARRLLPGGTFEHELIRSSSALHVEHAGLFHRLGDNNRCLELAHQALIEAEEIGDRRAEAKALQRLHLAITFLRDPDDEGWGHRALDLFREFDEHDQVAVVLNNLGVQAYFAGNWNDAIEFYAESADARERAGNTLELTLAALNTGELLSDQGHWERAADILADALRNAEAVGYGAAIGVSKLFAGVNERRREHWQEAFRLLTEARDEFTDLGLADYAQDATSRLLELDVFRGHGSQIAVTEMLASVGDDHPLATRLRWLLGLIAATEGDRKGAMRTLIAEVERSTGIAQARTAEALVLLEPELPDLERYRSITAEQYATAGVVRMATLPFVA